MKTEYLPHGAVAARKRLLVPKTNVNDDSMSVDYNDANARIIVAHTVDEDNVYQIQADSNGVWYHKKDNGSWTTVPLAVSAGGTGATNADSARTNLGLNPVTFNVTAASGATVTSTSFRVGKIGYLSLRVNITRDNIGTIATIPSGFRPRTNVYLFMATTNKAAVDVAINTAGQVLVVSDYTKSVTYRLNVAYICA